MIRTFQPVAIAFSLVIIANANADDASRVPHVFEGIWSGSWGGGQKGDVVLQPVIAELVIVHDHAEFHGFPNLNNPSGKVRFDARKQTMRFIPSPRAGKKVGAEVHFTYELKDDQLTLTTEKKVSVTLRRENTTGRPAVDTRLEIFPNAKIDDSGKLNLDRFVILQVKDSSASYLGTVGQRLSLDKATIGVVEASGWRKITVEQAASLVQAAPVAVLRKDVNDPARRQSRRLWKITRSPPTDSDVVWMTLSRSLRPGTVVFVLEPEKVPLP